jgi:hypothetical protein
MTARARQRWLWWSICVIFVLVLYATLPLGRPVITWVRGHLTHAQQMGVITGAFAMLAAGCAAYIAVNWRRYTPLAIVCFFVFCRLYWLELQRLQQYPEEQLHFVEYGVLAMLLHRAFAIDLKGLWPYIATLALGALVGLGDECVQGLTKYVLPETYRRYFGWSDVRINVIGVVYGLAFYATVLRNRRAT